MEADLRTNLGLTNRPKLEAALQLMGVTGAGRLGFVQN